MFEVNNLNEAILGIGASPSDRLFATLNEAYGEVGRHYHTGTHIAECLRYAKRYQDLARSISEIEVSIWFHDAIYDTTRSDNEEKSATLAECELTGLGAPPSAIERVVEMILATKTHVSAHPDTRLLLDIDLGVLGAEPTAFESYDRDIRKEFSWVPEAAYRAGRSRVLTSFLEREHIFSTHVIRERIEARARENLKKKIAELCA